MTKNGPTMKEKLNILIKQSTAYSDFLVARMEESKNSESNASAFTQPALVTGGTLKDYQLSGVQWLVSLYENGLNGILADEMGLGKTLQTIAFLAFLRERKVFGPFLIVAPLSTLSNWVNEFNRFTPDVPVLLYHGTIQERAELRRQHLRKVNAKFPVIITSYDIVMNDRKHLCQFSWKFIIVDEGHRLKNLDCKLIRELKMYRSANRLLLTGTPLQNNLRELWSLLNFLLPEIFTSADEFERWFDFDSNEDGDEENAENVNEIKVEDDNNSLKLNELKRAELVNKLHLILKPFLLRRLKVEVAKDLPTKREYILHLKMSEMQKVYYKAALDHKLREIITGEKEEVEVDLTENFGRGKRKRSQVGYDEEMEDDMWLQQLEEMEEKREANLQIVQQEGANVARVVERQSGSKNLQFLVMQLRKVCNHPYLFTYPVDPETQEMIASPEIVEASAKMRILEQLLDALFASGHKVLIFSQMKRVLDIIETWAVDLKGWNVCRIDGNVSHESRTEQIHRFNTDPDEKLFLLTTRSGGVGINLSSADTVVLFDSDFNATMDLQAQDRVHRIGQKRPVNIYRFAIANSVETRILKIAANKRVLEKMVIHRTKFKGKNSLTETGMGLGVEELEELIKEKDGEEVAIDGIMALGELERVLERGDCVKDKELEKVGITIL